jgi:hypothetical protein
MLLKVRQTARIVFDKKRNTMTVQIGVTIPHFGSLYSCEEWCDGRGIKITNIGEVNRLKYNNMPVQEMF